MILLALLGLASLTLANALAVTTTTTVAPSSTISLLPLNQWYAGFQDMMNQVNAQRKIANKTQLCISP